MERLRTARRPLRRMFKDKVDKIKTELDKEVPDNIILKTILASLHRYMKEINEIDSQILNFLLDNNTDEDFQKAREDMEKYEGELEAVEIRANDVLHKITPPSSPTYWSARSSSCSSHHKKTFRLPKIEIKKFGGDIKEWLGWWAQFAKIHEDEDLHVVDKFTYLLQAMTPETRAEELVKSYPMTPENYPKVIEALKNRFGKEKLLMQVYVRELLKLVISNNSLNHDKLKISKLYDSLESHLRSLDSLGVTTDQMAVFLFPMVESSLSDELLVTWQRSPFNGKDGSKDIPPKTELDYLMEFLRREVEHEDQRELVQSGFSTDSTQQAKSKPRQKQDKTPTAAGLYASTSPGGSLCIFCEKGHPSHECGKAQSLTLTEKQNKVKEKNVCFACLKPKHSVKQCKTFVRCLLCSQKHYTLMCPDLPSRKPIENSQSPANSSSKPVSEEIPSNAMTNHYCSGEVLLQTLLVRILGPHSSHVARLIFDNGSQRSYIRKKTAAALRLRPQGEEWIRKALFGGTVTESKAHQKFNLKLERLDGLTSHSLQVLDEEEICGRIRRVPRGPWIEELANKNIMLSDFWSDSPEIEVLVGSDHYGQFMTGKLVHLLGGLTAFETIFGWTLGGKLPLREESHSMTVTTLLSQNYSIQDLWELETIGISDPSVKLSKEEEEAKVRQQFLKSTSRLEDGRYSVRLPWVEGAQVIPNNRNIAEKRLISTTKKLQQKDMIKEYGELFQSWLEEGIIEEVQEGKVQNLHYLPHHPVFKPESLTTPVRPVFDASCKSFRSPSLNECLYKGPNLISLIPSVLHRFREKKIGVVSDIRKAFQMIDVKEDDRDFLRFLWWEDLHKRKIKTYRHKRVVFGLNCSPYLLAATLELHLEGTYGEKKEIAEKLLESLYVDNCVTSVDTDEEYEGFKAKSMEIMAEAKMELRQWERTLDLNPPTTNNSNFTGVLGLSWDLGSDLISCRVKEKIPETLTKRVVLSQVHQIFDPLGITSPALLQPKLLLQRSWKKKSGWDDPLSEEDGNVFKKWCAESLLLNQIQIPRYLGGGSELHVFCDASQDAYATVIYARNQLDGSVKIVQAKSRVAPIKEITINRLELLSCLIGARLAHVTTEALPSLKNSCHFWSDSSTALAWIRRNDEWGTFVGNRVKEIVKVSDPSLWHHVPGHLNPADLPSRSCSPSHLVQSKWWEGPAWLRNPEDWPSKEERADENAIVKELKKSATLASTALQTKQFKVLRFSSHLKNVRVRGWIHRFITNIKKKRNRNQSKFLSITEMRVGELDLLKRAQLESFPFNSKEVFGLLVERDAMGLTRVRTRLTQKSDKAEFLRPILLPNDHPITTLIIEECHKLHGHIGTQSLLGKLRERFWIPQGRKTVRRVVNKCIICRRFGAKGLSVDPAALPEKRVSNAEPFETTGVDLLGPLFLKNGTKVWVVLYTCALYRAVILDIVSSLSSEDFIESLQRFVNVYGRPNTIYSDNGTNFVGAANLFKEINWKKVQDSSHSKQIQWIFIPPTAAWWGGWWERLVRTVKDLLKRTLGRARMTFDKLRTCLAAVQASINDRPLTTITEDINDLIPLTPSMFLRGIKDSSFPEGSEIGSQLQIIYSRAQVLHKQLQERFRKEYLSQLVQRSKEKGSPPPQIGDIVMISVDNKKRLEWPLGRIVELVPGKDHKVRVARVKTARGELIRPLQHLYPLEISSPVDCPSISKTTKAKAIKQANQMQQLVPQQEEEPQIKTRSGRIIRKPVPFGH